MKVLLAENPERVKNYMAVLDYLGVDYDATLNPKNINDYDKLLIPGGGDVNPKLYGEENTDSSYISEELDDAQYALLDHFVARKKPIFGICRGQQIINVYFGGSLIQDIKSKINHPRVNNLDQFHFASTNENTVVRKLYGKDCKINSSHHQAVKDLAEGFEVTMMSEDGFVEGISHKSLPILCVQWHPERTTLEFLKDDVADGLEIFKYFLYEM